MTMLLKINKEYGIKTFWKDYAGYNVFEKLADSHNQCRKYFLDNDFDFMFHLETDIFPEPTIIEDLLFARKDIISAIYFLTGGAIRELCLRIIEKGEPFNNAFASGCSLSIHNQYWIDGTIKECLTAGLGCCLIHKKIVKNFPFRWIKTMCIIEILFQSLLLIVFLLMIYIKEGLGILCIQGYGHFIGI